MNFVDAARLATLGAGRIIAGYTPPSQTVSGNGLVMVTPNARGPQSPAAPMQRAMLVPPAQARYDLLRRVARLAPRTPDGRHADHAVRRGQMMSRFRFSGSVVRREHSRADAVIAKVSPHLMAKADPTGALREALRPSPQRRAKTLKESAMEAMKFVAVKQLQIVPGMALNLG